MLGLNFQHTVSALCYSIIDQHCQPADAIASGTVQRAIMAFPNNEVVEFVLEQHQRMPDFLRFPILILTLILDGLTLLWRGAPFHTLPPNLRSQQIEAWRNSRFSFCRDLIRFYESLTLFSWYSLNSEC
jgi:hypothetical protein